MSTWTLGWKSLPTCPGCSFWLLYPSSSTLSFVLLLATCLGCLAVTCCAQLLQCLRTTAHLCACHATVFFLMASTAGWGLPSCLCSTPDCSKGAVLSGSVDARHPVETAFGLVRRVQFLPIFSPCLSRSFLWFWRPMVVNAERGARGKKNFGAPRTMPFLLLWSWATSSLSRQSAHATVGFVSRRRERDAQPACPQG